MKPIFRLHPSKRAVLRAISTLPSVHIRYNCRLKMLFLSDISVRVCLKLPISFEFAMIFSILQFKALILVLSHCSHCVQLRKTTIEPHRERIWTILLKFVLEPY